MRVLTAIVVCAALVLAVVSAPCADEKATVTAKTKSIAAFKNGLGFFVREGEADLSDGWAVYDGIPPASLGTFWVGSPKPGVGIERLVASEEEITKRVPAVSIAEMLASNVGADVTLTIGDKEISGRLLAAPDDRKPAADQPLPNPRYGGYAPPSPTPSSIVLLETPERTMAINKSQINWVSFAGKAKSDFAAKEKAKRLRFKVTGAKGKTPVTIGYLQKGFSWSPAYLVEMLDDAKARITMQGLLINDVEDIDGADVTFVVGYPNFTMSDTLSPLALTQSLADFVASLNRIPSGYGYGGFSNALMGQSASYYERDALRAPDQFGYASGKETPGAPEEDLFLYRMKDVSLKQGERAYYTVFSAEIPYKHIYEWSVPDTSNVQPSGHLDSSRRNEAVPMDEQIWHKLRLTDTSPYPWTTAPAMVMSGGQPLSQDTINYTPKGANGDLRVTVATDIKGSKTENEKSREPTKIGYSQYYDVTAEGKLTLKSFKAKPVTVIVKKTVVGEALAVGQGGKSVKSTEIRAVNPTSVITWEVTLQPGEEKSVDYSYHTYISY